MEGRRVSRHEGKQINYNEKNVALVSTPNWLKVTTSTLASFLLNKDSYFELLRT